jgi:cell shape-determining protein MreC
LVIIFLAGAIIFTFFNQKIIAGATYFWRMKNSTLTAENISLAQSNNLAQQNIFLELAGRKPVEHVIVATVLSRPPQTPYDVIMIDAGANESLTINSIVSLSDGVALGVVSEVFPTSAKVKLFSTSGQEINAILERDSIPITMVGGGGGNFRFTLPRDINIEIGDRILSADIMARPLATVGAVNVQPTDSFKQVLAISPANIFTLRFVFVAP